VYRDWTGAHEPLISSEVQLDLYDCQSVNSFSQIESVKSNCGAAHNLVAACTSQATILLLDVYGDLSLVTS